MGERGKDEGIEKKRQRDTSTRGREQAWEGRLGNGKGIERVGDAHKIKKRKQRVEEARKNQVQKVSSNGTSDVNGLRWESRKMKDRKGVPS